MNEKEKILNAELEDLAFLIGEWKIELIFPSQPDKIFVGNVKFDWFEEGAFLIIYTGSKGSGMPFSICIIGKDNAKDDYSCLYIDDRRVSRIYQMSFHNNEWKQWRDQSGFYQRFTGKINESKKRIIAFWEKSANGTNWQLDFNINYIKK